MSVSQRRRQARALSAAGVVPPAAGGLSSSSWRAPGGGAPRPTRQAQRSGRKVALAGRGVEGDLDQRRITGGPWCATCRLRQIARPLRPRCLGQRDVASHRRRRTSTAGRHLAPHHAARAHDHVARIPDVVRLPPGVAPGRALQGETLRWGIARPARIEPGSVQSDGG